MNSTQEKAKEIWNRIIDKLKETEALEESYFNLYIPNVTPKCYVDSTLTLYVSDLFFHDEFNKIILPTINGLLVAFKKKTFDNESIKINIEINEGLIPTEVESNTTEKKEKQVEEVQANINTMFTQDDTTSLSREQLTAPHCNADLTFDTFVVSETTKVAYEMSKSVAKSPGTINPLFIYGNVGLGKSHLLQAVANEFFTNNHKSKILFSTCEEMMRLYVSSIKTRKHDDFVRKFREVDMLIIDDIQLLTRGEQVQEEFFNIFNSLNQKGKQIVLASDKQPRELKGLEERLVSRFSQGFITEVLNPTIETRVAILKQNQEKNLTKLPEHVLYFIAKRVTSNVRALISAFVTVSSHISILQIDPQTITDEFLQDILRPHLSAEAENVRVSIDTIQQAVAKFYNISVADICGKARTQNIANPRLIAMYLSKTMTTESYSSIGRCFSKRHGTIMSANDKIKGKIEDNPAFANEIELVKREILKHA